VTITTPAADAVVPQPGTTHVVVPDGSNLSNVSLTADGNDVTNQFAYSSASGNYEANLALAGGVHTIVASADARCFYCTGQKYRSSDTKTFCVSGTPGITSKTVFAQGDNLGWSSATSHTLAIAADAGTETKWTLWPKGAGIVSVPGIIQSRMFPCYCIRSPNDNNGAVMELAPCDFNDTRQIWDGTQEQLVNGVAFYRFRNEGVGVVNRGCLAEGNATDGTTGKLVQGDCTTAGDRLWKVHHNNLNSFESGQTPWGQ
jgi:hypothetical protein